MRGYVTLSTYGTVGLRFRKRFISQTGGGGRAGGGLSIVVRRGVATRGVTFERLD
jgi:hypothetical protein